MNQAINRRKKNNESVKAGPVQFDGFGLLHATITHTQASNKHASICLSPPQELVVACTAAALRKNVSASHGSRGRVAIPAAHCPGRSTKSQTSLHCRYFSPKARACAPPLRVLGGCSNAMQGETGVKSDFLSASLYRHGHGHGHIHRGQQPNPRTHRQ